MRVTATEGVKLSGAPYANPLENIGFISVFKGFRRLCVLQNNAFYYLNQHSYAVKM